MTEFQDASKKLIFSKLADWWLSKSRYGDDILRMGVKLADAALQLYTSCLQELLPTPSRSHYTWNLRDLSSLFTGMAASGSTLQSVDDVARLFVHESLRVFGDRLVDDHDREWFATALSSTVEANLRLKWYANTSSGLERCSHCEIKPEMCITHQSLEKGGNRHCIVQDKYPW